MGGWKGECLGLKQDTENRHKAYLFQDEAERDPRHRFVFKRAWGIRGNNARAERYSDVIKVCDVMR